MSALRRTILGALLTAATLFAVATVGVVAQPGTAAEERIVVVGDVHGDLEGLLTVLGDAGLIDRRNNWRGGRSRLVQLGDLPDRGPDTRRIIELMRQWQKQAAAAGGAVHVVIGNHEAMNMLGDLRYVHPGEYEAFRSWGSRSRRDRFYRDHIARRQAAEPEFVADRAYRQAFDERVPLGFVEHRLAWAPDGEIGAWVLEQPTVIRLDGILFLHGGISPALLGMSIEEINARLREELQTGVPDLAVSEPGPLWYRGLALHDEAEAAQEMRAVLENFDVDHVVVGHTPMPGVILPRFDGRLIVADAGLSAAYGGYRVSLEIREGRFYARYGETLLPLPGAGAPLLPYLRAVRDLGIDEAALQRRIEELEAGEAGTAR